MFPLLYSQWSDNNGSFGGTFKGILSHCISCEVTEVRNGAYTLSLETTINEPLANIITSQMGLMVKANPFDDLQRFVITDTERTIDGHIKVNAVHVKSLLDTIYSEGDVGTDTTNSFTGTPANAWNTLEADYLKHPSGYSPFTFTSNITTSKTLYLGLNTVETLGNILGGKEGSFLDVWGGEFHWDNSNIIYRKSRGSNSDYIIRYGQNISDASQKETFETSYAYVMPYGKVSCYDSHAGTTSKINFFADLVRISGTNCLYHKVFLLDCTDLLDTYQVGTDATSRNTVKAVMEEYATAYAANNGLGNIQVSIEVDLRAELDEMSEIGLCDTVNVVLDNFGTTTTAKVVEATYDVLLERWNKLVVGNHKVSVADLILNKRRFINGKK